jgi:hypothetical protein
MDETRRRRKTGVNPSLGFWLEIIGAPILIAFYAEAYSSKDYAVGVFLEIEILTGEGGRMVRGGLGLPKVSLGPAMPSLFDALWAGHL